MATLIPAAVKSNSPIVSPNMPMLPAISIAPWTNKCPNDVIGTRAPAPAYSTILSYIPNISKNAPITTNRLVTCPGVSLVLSKIICDIKHTIPQNKKAYRYVKKCIAENKPLDENIVKDLHAILTENIIVGGIYRKEEVRISGAGFTPPAGNEMYMQIKNL